MVASNSGLVSHTLCNAYVVYKKLIVPLNKSYLHSVTELRTTFTKLSNPVSRQVISGRGSSVLPFYNNNWF